VKKHDSSFFVFSQAMSVQQGQKGDRDSSARLAVFFDPTSPTRIFSSIKALQSGDIVGEREEE
jgi:hypothetical protein